MMRHPLVRVVLMAAVACGVAAPVHAQSTSLSAEQAPVLANLMTTRQLDAFAVADPAQPGRYNAVLVIPGVELLVISASSPSAAVIDQRLAARAYRDVYLDLQGTPTATGKMFVQDMNLDGIRDAQNGAADIVDEDGTRETVFAKASAKHLKGEAYEQALKSADARYAQVLGVLIDGLKSMPVTATAAK
jgi:hypothetical protein